MDNFYRIGHIHFFTLEQCIQEHWNSIKGLWCGLICIWDFLYFFRGRTHLAELGLDWDLFIESFLWAVLVVLYFLNTFCCWGEVSSFWFLDCTKWSWHLSIVFPIIYQHHLVINLRLQLLTRRDLNCLLVFTHPLVYPWANTSCPWWWSTVLVNSLLVSLLC